jgi:hypothetical protein
MALYIVILSQGPAGWNCHAGGSHDLATCPGNRRVCADQSHTSPRAKSKQLVLLSLSIPDGQRYKKRVSESQRRDHSSATQGRQTMTPATHSLGSAQQAVQVPGPPTYMCSGSTLVSDDSTTSAAAALTSAPHSQHRARAPARPAPSATRYCVCANHRAHHMSLRCGFSACSGGTP